MRGVQPSKFSNSTHSLCQKLEPGRSLESLLKDADGDMVLKAIPSTSSTKSVIHMKEYDPDVTSHLLAQNSQLTRSWSRKGLRLSTPNNKPLLVQNLDVSVGKDKDLLIVGALGLGESGLLRALLDFGRRENERLCVRLRNI